MKSSMLTWSDAESVGLSSFLDFAIVVIKCRDSDRLRKFLVVGIISGHAQGRGMVAFGRMEPSKERGMAGL